MTRPRRDHVLIWILWIGSLLHALTARRRAIQILLPALIVGACFRMPESRDSVRGSPTEITQLFVELLGSPELLRSCGTSSCDSLIVDPAVHPIVGPGVYADGEAPLAFLTQAQLDRVAAPLRFVVGHVAGPAAEQVAFVRLGSRALAACEEASPCISVAVYSKAEDYGLWLIASVRWKGGRYRLASVSVHRG